MSKWYKEGLCFSCTGCGKCCTGAPGYVWLTKEEMQEIADFLKISLEEFAKTYVRQVGNRYSLLETLPNYDCIFLKEGKCQVYDARPKQCRTYPFWPHILASKTAWKNEARACEGINEDAPRISAEEIETLIQIEERD